MPDPMNPDDVPIELRKLAVAAMNANDALPEDDQDMTPDHILAAVIPAIRAAERAKVAAELHAEGRRLRDGGWDAAGDHYMEAGRFVQGSDANQPTPAIVVNIEPDSPAVARAIRDIRRRGGA